MMHFVPPHPALSPVVPAVSNLLLPLLADGVEYALLLLLVGAGQVAGHQRRLTQKINANYSLKNLPVG